jgi:hypothetical protein
MNYYELSSVLQTAQFLYTRANICYHLSALNCRLI